VANWTISLRACWDAGQEWAALARSAVAHALTLRRRRRRRRAGEDAIRHLLSRGTHREFGYAALVVMLVFYFGGAVWAAGSAIASGLFVPMLLIGSCIGRLVGLAAVDIAAAGGRGSAECAPDGLRSNVG